MRRDLVETPTLGTQGGIIGRSRKLPPPEAAKRIEDYAADGFSVVGVAMKLGTTREILRRWMMDDPALQESFDAGRERERHALHNALYRKAMEEDGKESIIAAMFLLKARHGYREGDQSEQGNRVSITFNLPGAMPLDQFRSMQVVTNGDTGTQGQSVPTASAPNPRRA